MQHAMQWEVRITCAFMGRADQVRGNDLPCGCSQLTMLVSTTMRHHCISDAHANLHTCHAVVVSCCLHERTIVGSGSAPSTTDRVAASAAAEELAAPLKASPICSHAAQLTRICTDRASDWYVAGVWRIFDGTDMFCSPVATATFIPQWPR